MSGKERWAAVPGWPDYQVSDRGRVRSRRPRNGVRLPGVTHPWRLLEPSVRKRSGYAFVGLRDGGRKRQRDVGVHRLVLEAFVGPCPEGMETRHLNGERADNRLANLCWGTPAENRADQARHGTELRGEAHPNAKLTGDVVRLMREWRAGGMTWKKLALAAGVSESAARRACGGGWRHVARLA